MKVIVAHPQQQHSYRLATALKKKGELGAYATTVYMKPGNLTDLVSKILPPFWKKKATGRHCDELEDSEVLQFDEARGLAVLFCRNIPLVRSRYDSVRRTTEDAFAEKVARLAEREGADAVVGYDGCSAALFERVGELSPETVRIADMSAANALYLQSVYERDVALRPEYSASLRGWNRIWDPVDVARTKRELASTDAFLCGSSFVVNSLAYSGVSGDICEVCHYGVDTRAFPYRERLPKGEDESLTFVYLGQVSEHKGIAWLFEAFSGIEPMRARLVCIGAVNLPDSITSKLPSNIELRGMVQHDEVSELLLSADAMLFPSLGDGFPLSIMEGFASGLPVVCTENTGAADCVAEGENGFVVPVQDADALRDRIEWFLANRAEIPRMAKAARDGVASYTWDAYYENAANAVEKLVEKVRSERER